MPSIYVNGVNLYYEQEGTGHPLVLIAGYTVDNSAWALVRPELAKHFQLFLLDNRGCGRSDCPDVPYTVEDMAHDTRAFIEALKLHKPHVMGHSMGGAIAQTLAFQHPEMIDKLVLVNSLIRLQPVQAYAQNYLLKQREAGMPIETLFGAILPWLFSGEFLSNQEKIDKALQMKLKYPYPQSLLGQKRQLAAVQQFDSERWFKKISVPTLVIEGGKDIICPDDSKRLAEGIPGAKLATFPDQGHMAQIEKPVEFSEVVLRFLK